MIVERRTYKAKEQQEMVYLIQAEMKAVGPDIVSRIYMPMIAPLSVIVHEMEFKDLAAREAFWAKWREKRSTPAFWEKWREAYGEGGNVEIWTLAD